MCDYETILKFYEQWLSPTLPAENHTALWQWIYLRLSADKARTNT